MAEQGLVGQSKSEPQGLTSRDYAVDLFRAFGGAVLFGFPLLMTMEMWSLGFAMDRWRLVLFLLLNLVLLVGLSYFAGLPAGLQPQGRHARRVRGLRRRDRASAALLVALDLISWGMTADEVAGQGRGAGGAGEHRRHGRAPAAGRQRGRGRSGRDGYAGELFLMLAGALFLAFNVAPTEEMILIAFLMTPWHALALVVVSIVMLARLRLFAGVLGPGGPAGRGRLLAELLELQPRRLRDRAAGQPLRALDLRADGRGGRRAQVAMMVTVLGFPAALGAAIARLVV